ncbi:MAG TPA: TonB-dependent receptor [Candidatus Binataceae bacterium]|nr:TonB-dependent receptor [Candidatus Binataceae bacterium]
MIRLKSLLIVPAALILVMVAQRARAAAMPTAAPSPGAQPSASPSPSAQAQAPPEKKLKTVVVTATRIEQPISEIGTTVTVVEGDQIEAQKIDRVGDVLREVPGVQITQSGSTGAVTEASIRGAPSAQTLVLVDGVEVNAGATGGFDLAKLTTGGLDRIEVLRGAGGSLYGSQAIGGVVNVLSQEGEGAPRFSLLSDGGNRATSNQVATATGSYGGLNYSGVLSYFSTEGFRPVNDNSDNLAGSTRLDYHLGDGTVLRGFARYIRSNVSLPDYLVFSGVPIDPTAHERDEFMLFKGEIEHRFTEQLTARASAFYVRQDVRVNAPPFAESTYFEDDSIADETRGGNLEAIYSWTANFRTLVGFDFLDRWVRSGSYCSYCDPNPPFGIGTTEFTARRQEYAGYVEQEARLLHDHLLLTGGFRADGNSQFGKEVSPAWSVAIPIDQISTTFRGSYTEGFRAPAFNELYYPDYGNPKLEPEISSEYDGGFTTAFGERATFTATYFSRRVHHLIVTVPCHTCIFGSEAGNAARVDVQGVEIVPSVTITKGLTFGGNVTVLDETHADAQGSTARPLRVPKHSAAALLAYQRGGIFAARDRITASVSYVFVGDRDDITVSGVPPIANHAAYNRVDAVASYALGRSYGFVHDEEIFARVSNLLDRHYSEVFGFPAPTINFVAGLKLEFE